MEGESSEGKKRTWRIRIFATIFSLAGLALIVALLQLTLDFFSSRSSDLLQETEIAIQFDQFSILAEIATVQASNPGSGPTATAVAERIALLAATLDALEPSQTGQITSIPETPTLEPSQTGQVTPIPETLTSVPSTEGSLAKLVLSNDDNNTYDWEGGAPYTTSQFVFEGGSAFIPTGNNTFYADLGLIGYEADEIRYIQIQVYLLKEDAALLLQAQVDGNWEHRWGLDGRTSFSGYSWRRNGQTLNLPVGEWITVTLDLIDDLGARPGQSLTGLAFSGDDGNVVYDYVVLSASGG